jgi:hypothetical protein
VSIRFDVEISLALGADITADPSTWSWTDISSRCMVRDGGVSITRGRSDWQSTVQPSTCTVLVNNSDGRFSRLNPLGIYYGQLTKNTPLRVRACAHGGALTTRFVGFVSEFPPRWEPSEHHFWVPIRADGVLRRLGLGQKPARSALQRAILAGSPVAYWPMEQTDPSTQIFSGLNGGSPIISGDGFTFTTGTPGSNGALDLVDDAAHDERTTVALSDTTGFQLEFVAMSDQGADTIIFEMISCFADGFGFGVTISSTLADGDGIHYMVRVVSSGGSSTIDLYRDGVLSSSTPYASTVASNLVLSLPIGRFSTGVVAMNHLAIHPYSAMPDPTDRTFAGSSYAGELTGDRFQRLCDEESVFADVTVGATETMGQQTIATLTELLGECEAAEEGLIVERLTGKIGFDPHVDRENQTVALALDYDLSQIKPPFEPTDDDRLTRNKVTVTRSGGSSATVEETVGPMGTDPETGAGVYEESVTLNLFDDTQPVQHAGYRVGIGTINEYRYPVVNLMFHSSSSILTSWLACDVGSRITIAHMPANMPKDTVDQILEGYTEQISGFEWNVELNLSPYKPYKVFTLANTTSDTGAFLGRLAPDDLCAIRTTITSGATSIEIDPNYYRWTTDSDDFPMTVRFGGETATLSSIATTAATFVAVGAASHADNAAVVPALYAGGSSGDLMFVHAVARGAATLSINQGYTQITVTGSYYLWFKVHTGSESNPTVTPTGGAAGDTVSAFSFGFRNMPTTLTASTLARQYIDKTNTGVQDIAFPGVYPIDAGTVVLLLAWKGDDYTSVAVPAGFTEMIEASTTVGNDQSLYAAYQIQTTPAVINEGSLVVTGGAAANSHSILLVVPGGFQTFTVSARSVNGTVKSHTRGTGMEIDNAEVLGL